MAADTMTELLAALVAQQARIATAMEILVSAQVPAPNYRRSLSEYKSFDWGDIGAHVLERDNYGPTKVEWNGRTFTRRNSADKKKGSAIWFSAVVSGTVADGNVKWGRLISFKDSSSEPEPLDAKIAPANQPAPHPSQAQVVAAQAADRTPEQHAPVAPATPAPKPNGNGKPVTGPLPSWPDTALTALAQVARITDKPRAARLLGLSRLLTPKSAPSEFGRWSAALSKALKDGQNDDSAVFLADAAVTTDTRAA